MVNQQRVLNKKLSQMFRMRGMSVRPDAMEALYTVLKEDEDWEQTMQTLLGELQQQKRTLSASPALPGPTRSSELIIPRRTPAVEGAHVDAASIEAALVAIQARSDDCGGLSIEVIDAFQMPLLKFDVARQAFVKDSAEPSAASHRFGADPEAKPSMYRLRLALLNLRISRNEMFKPPVRRLIDNSTARAPAEACAAPPPVRVWYRFFDLRTARPSLMVSSRRRNSQSPALMPCWGGRARMSYWACSTS